MSSTYRRNRPQQPIRTSIGTVLNTAANSNLPPGLSLSGNLHWIGPTPPEKGHTTQCAAMKHPVTIHFTSPGLQPPVFVCTNLSDPSWEPLEMESIQAAEGEYAFSKTFQAAEGDYQYKLRLGLGDWWICDDSKPKVNDGAGNQNNQITVTSVASAISTSGEAGVKPLPKADSPIAPPMPHEVDLFSDQPPSTQSLAFTVPDPIHPAPLFRHESLTLLEDGHDCPSDELDNPPLLHHESVPLASHEQEQAPLFRHETIATDHTRSPHNDHGGHNSNDASPQRTEQERIDRFVPEEADLSDPSLERFPTDHNGIMEHLRRACSSIETDAAAEDHMSVYQSAGESAVVRTSTLLPSVAEGEEEQDQSTFENAPQQRILENAADHDAPMTPPLTPIAQDEKALEDTAVGLQSSRGISVDADKTIKEIASQVPSLGLPAIALGVALTVAAAAVWYVRARGDNAAL